MTKNIMLINKITENIIIKKQSQKPKAMNPRLLNTTPTRLYSFNNQIETTDKIPAKHKTFLEYMSYITSIPIEKIRNMIFNKEKNATKTIYQAAKENGYYIKFIDITSFASPKEMTYLITTYSDTIMVLKYSDFHQNSQELTEMLNNGLEDDIEELVDNQIREYETWTRGEFTENIEFLSIENYIKRALQNITNEDLKIESKDIQKTGVVYRPTNNDKEIVKIAQEYFSKKHVGEINEWERIDKLPNITNYVSIIN